MPGRRIRPPRSTLTSTIVADEGRIGHAAAGEDATWYELTLHRRV
jgi:hypothetical protein